MTVSYIPGRVRIENPELSINFHRCAEISRRIGRIPGVKGADINCGTGRALIRFDEAITDRELLLGRVKEIIMTPEETEKGEPADCASGDGAGKNKKSLFSHLFMDMAGHALLPGPLGFLLPFAMTALRKDPV